MWKSLKYETEKFNKQLLNQLIINLYKITLIKHQIYIEQSKIIII